MSPAILLTSIIALAQAGDDAPRWRDPPACWDGPQSELTHCAWVEYRRADAAMNAQWQVTTALMRRLDADHPPVAAIGQSSRSAALLNGQRAWLAFRDAHCSIAGTAGGSMAPMLRGLCLRDATKVRTEQLKELMLNPASGNRFYED